MFRRRDWCALLIATPLIIASGGTPSFATTNGQGGAYLILELDVARLREQQLENIADQITSALREATPAIRHVGQGIVNDAVRVRLVEQADLQRALSALRNLVSSPEESEEILTISVADNGVIEARLTPFWLRTLSQRAVLQSMRVIRRRIDPAGTGAIEIEQQGDLRILIRAPLVSDASQLRRSIGIGQLTFHLVREVSPEYSAAGRIPPGTMRVEPHPGIGESSEVVERRPRLTGERLARFNPTTDSRTGEFALSFMLDAEGTRTFCRITRDNVGRRFAVLLDNRVLTAPRINEPICAGRGQISGNFTAESANDLAVIVSGGALPAPLIVVEEGLAPTPR